tara:strand:+ start:560 stop:1573 length:1014 start_codon:yes stop_codon:yes gene_type:complete
MIIIFFLLVLNLLIFLNFKRISNLLNIFDKPDGKLKLHKTKIPIVGGIILITNFSILFIYQILFLNQFLFLNIENLFRFELLSLLLLIYGYFFLGLYDDKYHLSPLIKLALSISIILVGIFLNKNLVITNFILSFHDKRIFFENFSIIFTIFCILILINSLNFFDGINVQSCLIFLVFFSYLFTRSDLNFFYLICIVLILIVMILNFKNMLFLGDSGIYLLGMILSISLIYEYNIQKNIFYADEIFFLLLLPGFDLVRLTTTRSLNSRNPFFGDRDHIHHLLIKRYSLVLSNIILFFLSILPIFLFLFIKINFFLIFFIFVVIYIFLIQFLKSSDKK